MKHYAGLDVSQQTTSICIVDEAGEIVAERKVSTAALTSKRTLSLTSEIRNLA